MLKVNVNATQLSAAKMALLRYLQRKDGLPDPKGSLSSEVPAATIAHATQTTKIFNTKISRTTV